MKSRFIAELEYLYNLAQTSGNLVPRINKYKLDVLFNSATQAKKDLLNKLGFKNIKLTEDQIKRLDVFTSDKNNLKTESQLIDFLKELEKENE